MKRKVLRVSFVIFVFYLGTLFGGMSHDSALKIQGESTKIRVSESWAVDWSECGKLEPSEITQDWFGYTGDKCGYILSYNTSSGQGYGVRFEVDPGWTK